MGHMCRMALIFSWLALIPWLETMCWGSSSPLKVRKMPQEFYPTFVEGSQDEGLRRKQQHKTPKLSSFGSYQAKQEKTK
jgi:hypothetical protein